MSISKSFFHMVELCTYQPVYCCTLFLIYHMFMSSSVIVMLCYIWVILYFLIDFHHFLPTCQHITRIWFSCETGEYLLPLLVFLLGKQPFLLLLADYFVEFPFYTKHSFCLTGAVTSASWGDCSARFSVKDESHRHKTISFYSQKNKFALFADVFASVSFMAQHGNFQRLFLDLTRLNARLDFPSGSTFLNGAARLAQDFYHSRQPDSAAIGAICPDMTVSLQQQVAMSSITCIQMYVYIHPYVHKNVFVHYIRTYLCMHVGQFECWAHVFCE